MSVTEQLMKPGSWSMRFVPGTPQDILDTCAEFGHVFILEAPVNARLLADADMKSVARWVGVVRRKPSPYELAGTGLLAWAGDEEGKGALVLALTLTANTFAQWVTAVMNTTPVTIAVGTVTAIAGTLTQTFTRKTSRYCVDFIMQFFGGEYRVRNNATLDAGPSSSLFVTTPTVVLLRRSGGRDFNVTGINASRLGVTKDGDSYTTDVLLVGAAGTGTASVGTPPYKDLRGNNVMLKRVVDSQQTAAGQENAIAAAQLALYPLRKEVALETLQFNVPADIAAGDWVYVYDVEGGFTNTANQVRYRGSILYPVAVRCYGITWPIERGYAVYYRDLNGVYTDLTNYVEWEPAGTSLDVGAMPRRLSD